MNCFSICFTEVQFFVFYYVFVVNCNTDRSWKKHTFLSCFLWGFLTSIVITTKEKKYINKCIRCSHSMSRYMLFWWPPILLSASQSKRPRSESLTPLMVNTDLPWRPRTSNRPSGLWEHTHAQHKIFNMYNPFINSYVFVLFVLRCTMAITAFSKFQCDSSIYVFSIAAPSCTQSVGV